MKQFVSVTNAFQEVIERHVAGNPSEVAELLVELELPNMTQEEIWVITLGADRSVRTVTKVAKGGYNSVPVNPATIFPAVYLAGCDRFILVHNHPSGRLEPTNDDYDLTRQIAEQAKILGLRFEDHIIMDSHGKWLSMRERGEMEGSEMASRASHWRTK